MTRPAVRTQFLPTVDSPPRTISAQSRHVAGFPLLVAALNALPEIVFILNKNRQIIFANEAAVCHLSGDGMRDLLGLRAGEAFKCVHAGETPGGCGTTKACRTCGNAKAFLAFQQGRYDPQECRIIQRKSGEGLDLRIHARRLRLRGGAYTIFVIADISDEKRREALEEIFFHDISNTAMSLCGRARMLKESGLSRPEEVTRDLARLLHQAEILVDEIQAQKDLAAAEKGTLALKFAPLRALALIERLAVIHSGHEWGRDRKLLVSPASKDAVVSSDGVLLGRVIGNMIKNALEACEPGETVTLGCGEQGGWAEFWVHNAGLMPEDVRLQVFQRSFSTKGRGRGLGTYGMKFLGERFLKGEVSFDSSQEQGTVFRIRLPLGPRTAEQPLS